jgi:hypothetical protein
MPAMPAVLRLLSVVKAALNAEHWVRARRR